MASPDDALEEIARCSGKHFNPRVVEAFFEVSEETFAAVHADRPVSPRFVSEAQRRRAGTAFDGTTMLRTF